MVQLYKNGVYLVNGTDIVEDDGYALEKLKSLIGENVPSKDEASKNTMAYGIL